jgi:AGZA family xanthine/uracil permease-like MFS transporter
MVSYILAVNPQILGVTGGTCDPIELCSAEDYRIRGKDCLFDPNNTEAADCLSTLRLGLTTATAASSLIACFIMGFFANLPLALAPGMGINIYVAYQVVAQDLLTYQQAMVAIFLEGWIFIILSMTGIRGGIIRLMPKNIAFASSVGIGLLLAFSGLRNLGVIVFDSNTLVTLGGCPAENHRYTLTTENPLDISNFNTTLNSTADVIDESNAAVYSCAGGEMRSATMWLGIAGGFLMAGLTAAHVRGSLFIGIAFITIISWIPGSPVSYLGAGSAIPGGQVRLEIFEKVVAAPSLEGLGLAWDWSGLGDGHFWVALFTFLYIDLLDCTGTLLSMATLLDDCMLHDAEEEGKLEVYEPFLQENREFEGQQWAFLSDGIGIVVGSMMGITPVTVYIESAAGIEDGGRTGVTAIAVAFFFFIALFFSPILASIPPYATGPALILVGVMLIAHVDRIVWDDTLESIPAFLTVIIMPFTLSVAYGVIAGIATYLALHIPIWVWKWTKLKIVEIKKRRRRRRKRRKSRTETEGGGSGHGGDGGGGPNNSIGGGSNGGGADLDEDSEEEDSNHGGAVSVSSTRSRRRVHRKVFGLERESSRNQFSQGIELGGVGGGSYGDLASLEVIDPALWGMSQSGRQGPVLGGGGGGGGLRRSTSHGNFHPTSVPSMGGSVHGGTAGMIIGSGPRAMPRSMSHAAYGGGGGGGGGSGYSSRNGSYGQEGILASSLGRGGGMGGAGGGGSMSPLRGPAANNFTNPTGNRAMSRAISMGANLGGGGGGGGNGLGYLSRASASGVGGVRKMSRSRTFTDVGGSVPAYGVGGFLGGGVDSNVLPIRYPIGYTAHGSAAVVGGGGGGAFQLFPTDNPIRLDGEEEVTLGSGENVQAPSSSFNAPGLGQGLSGATDDSFLLFGGKLLSLDLESDADAVVAEKEKGTNSTVLAGTAIPIPPAAAAMRQQQQQQPTAAADSSSIENQESIALSSPDRMDLGQFPSVDLEAFKAGMGSDYSFGGLMKMNRSGSSASGGGGGGSRQQGSGEMITSTSGYLAGLPVEDGITIHKSISGKGSVSFNEEAEDAVAAHAAAAELAAEKGKTESGGGGGHSTIRVEGWPSSSNTSPEKQPQLLATSLLPTEKSGGGGSGSRSGGPTLKRVESAAAIRLRNLFETDDEASYRGSDSNLNERNRSGSAAASPPSVTQPVGISSSSPAPIRAPHRSFSGAAPSSPFDQLNSPPENESGGGGEQVVSPHHILSPRAAAAAANINLPSTITSGQVWSSEDVSQGELNIKNNRK